MIKLRNEFIMAPIKLGYADGTGEINQKHLKFYAERSKYIGAITPEPLYLDKGLREIPSQIGIDCDGKLPGLRQLTATIHAQGAAAIAHLSHPGRMANPKLPGNYFISSTDRPCENGGATPKRMEREELEKVKQLFADAASRAEKAGFDIIELQFGHGYLLAQFLSPAVNDREDKYGGSFENRVRFPLEVLDAVKWATSLPVIARVSGEEMTPDGIKIDETIRLVEMLKSKGVKAVHVSAGTVCSTPPWFFQHMFVPKGKTWQFAKKIKEETGMPTIFVGRINSIADINCLKEDYKPDFIALGRALVADPDFIGKYLGETSGPIRPCLACSEGCLGGVKAGKGLGCVVNPLAGKESEEPVRPAATKKKFAVIGGGLAGMEAALTLKRRGHEVVIFERKKLGGQFNLAWLPPNKESLKDILNYYAEEIRQNEIPVIYEEATAGKILNKKFDAVILATGAKPVIPPVEGLKKYFWAEFLEEENLPHNKKIVVIGGGLIGIEIASKLTDAGNEVIVVELLDEVARGMEMIEKALTLKKLKIKNIPLYSETRVAKVEGDRVYLTGKQNMVLDNIDHIVVATGMESYRPLEKELEGRIPVYTIGDARKVGKAQEAIADAFITAEQL